MERKTIGQRLRELRENKGLSQRKLAMLCGLDRGYISQLEAGRTRSITLRTAEILAGGLNILPNAFFDSNVIINRSPISALSDLEVSIKAYIPVYAEVCAGEGIEPIDYVACTRARPAPETMRAYRVKGLCLSPEIEEGDTVIVDTSLSPQNNDLIVCIINGEASIKRFKEDGQDNKWLEDNNGKYQPENVYLHGIIIEFNRRIR